MGEQEELTGNPGIPMEVSLHALSDFLKRKTITLQGLMGGRLFSLFDTGSSHSFITPDLVLALQLTAEKTGPLMATIADGKTIIRHAICRDVKWQVQAMNFSLI